MTTILIVMACAIVTLFVIAVLQHNAFQGMQEKLERYYEAARDEHRTDIVRMRSLENELIALSGFMGVERKYVPSQEGHYIYVRMNGVRHD